MKITFFFRWYDLWIGMFIDMKKKAVYICFIPMIGIKIDWNKIKQDAHMKALKKKIKKENIKGFTN